MPRGGDKHGKLLKYESKLTDLVFFSFLESKSNRSLYVFSHLFVMSVSIYPSRFGSVKQVKLSFESTKNGFLVVRKIYRFEKN